MSFRRGLYFMVGVAALVTAGCGGGGGDSPGVTIDRTTVSVSANVLDATVSTPSVTLTISNAPGSGLYVAGATSHNGVSTLSPGVFSGSTAVIQIFLKTPYTLAPATYADTVQLEVCTDQSCAQQISGSPLTVKVTYTIAPAPAGSAPAMTVTTNAISAQALPTDGTPPAGFGVTIARAPGFPLTAKLTQTSHAVLSTAIDPPAPIWNTPPQAGFGVDVTLKSPGELSPGVYTDQITVEVCLDADCVNPLSGSPQTVSVTYQIGNSVPGGYTVSLVGIQAVDMVADNQRVLLYAAVPASASSHPSSVAVIDPVNALVTAYVSTAFDPGKVAIADDGSYLYVGEHNGPHIARFLLPALTLDTTITLANDAQGQVTWPIDIKVQPGSPKTIAVARDWKDDTAVQGDGVVIYDDTTARAQIAGLDAQGHVINQIGYLSWGGTAGTLYGSGRAEVDVLTVSATGAQVSASARPGNVYRIQYVGGVLYADSGILLDPASLAVIGALPAPNYPGLAVTADASVPRVYKITSTGGGGTYLYQYDPATLAAHDNSSILGVYVQYLVGTAFSRWGTSGLAFLATDQQAAVDAPNDQVVLISGPSVVQP